MITGLGLLAIVLIALLLGSAVLVATAVLAFLIPPGVAGVRRTLRLGALSAALLLLTGMLAFAAFEFAPLRLLGGIEHVLIDDSVKWSLGALFLAGGVAGLGFLASLWLVHRGRFRGGSPAPVASPSMNPAIDR